MHAARDITKALRGQWYGSFGMVSCPMPGHGRGRGDKKPSLKIYDQSDGYVGVLCFSGCHGRGVKAELRRMDLLPGFAGAGAVPSETGEQRQARQEVEQRERVAKIAWAVDIWNESESAQGTPVEVYLKVRGINLLPPTIRYHSALKHADTGCYFPAMIASITKWPSREVTGVQRTYLQSDGHGKANVASPKKMAGCCAGGAVRLAAVGEVLGLAEGLETALSALLATGIPTWACLSAPALKSVVIPDNVKEVFIFGDGDPPGIRAANEAAERFGLVGKTVRLVTAPQGKDWNDVLMGSDLREAAYG